MSSKLLHESEFARAVEIERTQGTVPVRHPWRIVSGVLVGLVVLGAIVSVARNEAFQWDVVAEYFFSGRILHGLWLTLWLTAVSTVLAFVVGTILAVMRMSHNAVLQAVSWAYVWLFRSIPLLVQLLFWFNIGYLYPKISLGIPFGPEWFSIETSDLIASSMVAIIGLTLHESAYAAEIIRSGLLSVDAGQTEAAEALGMPHGRILRRIVLPQAMRVILPPAGSLLISTLKATSMVSVIAVTDLLYAAQLIYNQNFLVIPLLMVVTIWYLILTSLLSVGQQFVEKRFARGTTRTATSTSLGTEADI
ncbi:amino acid ABC transporter permease [Rhodococcus sp. Z13]|uniref:Amino acid ABC transporter permease n=1 Tax=Rhodococcus sacchari TaxID=2962047 RepID=A0ACD4DED4_9NOCA|nr:amino acid ABC transporter permease [Rhodococcus sp. Z13]UYP18356.1 amino acid ABC transporter permease [Rhodococcus sp. Z13]